MKESCLRTSFLLLTVVALGIIPASAAVVDLTVNGGTTDYTGPCTNTAGVGLVASCVINGASYVWVDSQSTGTGVIDPFVRIQANGAEQGLNTDAVPQSPENDAKSGIWTHSTLLSDFGGFDVGGVRYIRFLLDINETASGTPSEGHLVLNDVEIFLIPLAAGGSLNSHADLVGAAGSIKVFDQAPDASGQGNTNDNFVKLLYDLNSGSGAGDMFLYVPLANFQPYANDASQYYLYLWSRFGDYAKAGLGAEYDSNDGFEEWNNPLDTLPIPEPTQFLGLLIVGVPVVWQYVRRRRADSVA